MRKDSKTANDLEGQQDLGGKHGGQAGVPKSPPRPKPTKHDPDTVSKRTSPKRKHDNDDRK